jgi:aminoglycoside phosphotransferase family enzyme/predicted kinase
MKPPGPGDALPIVNGLLRPAAYPHTVIEPIRLVETHVSWVLLTGELAYKVKKPLRLSFLDYSTLARRRALCEEEVRLNQRHAPDMYLGVSVIAGPAEAPRVDGRGSPLEYAVRMRQFNSGDELGALLAANAVTMTEMARLGADIAHLHQHAAPALHDDDYGHPDTVRRVTLDNFAELRRLPECVNEPGTLERLEAGVTEEFGNRQQLMLGRRDAGQVRECHGDLHCGNVVRWRGRLTPFDGIEFDPALRFIDVVNDIAFLTMDLAERGRPDLRHAALQAWCESTGDFAGLPLLPYYECYRALVRAKVAALGALHAPTPSEARDAAVATCRRYLGWAMHRLGPRRPALLLTCGLSGSGKTWLARVVAPEFSALHVRSDVERKRLAGLAPHEDSRSEPDGGIYTLEFNARTYERLERCAVAALAGGESVIVDAAFLRRAERLRFLDLAATADARAVILHCQAPQAILRQRVADRHAARSDASEAGVDLLARQPSYWEGFDERELAQVIEVDTSAARAAEDALGDLRARLAA